MKSRMLLTGLSIVFLINLMQAAEESPQQFPEININIRFTNNTNQKIALKYFDKKQGRLMRNFVKPKGVLQKEIPYTTEEFDKTISIDAAQNRNIGNVFFNSRLQELYDPYELSIKGLARLTIFHTRGTIYKEDDIEYEQSTMPKQIKYSINVTLDGADSTIDLGASVE